MIEDEGMIQTAAEAVSIHRRCHPNAWGSLQKQQNPKQYAETKYPQSSIHCFHAVSTLYSTQRSVTVGWPAVHILKHFREDGRRFLFKTSFKWRPVGGICTDIQYISLCARLQPIKVSYSRYRKNVFVQLHFWT